MTLAQACKFQLTKDLAEVYDGMAEKRGYPAACDAVKHFLMDRGTNDPFPSVKDLLERIDPASLPMLPEDEARTAASRAISAVAKFGRTNPVQARTFVGELGWKAVETVGGWSTFCAALTTSNLSVYQSQLTNMALTIFRRTQKGLPEYAPGLPERVGSIVARLAPR